MHSLEKTLIKTELKQRREEGCDVAGIAQQVAQAFADDAADQTFEKLYDDLISLPVDDAFPFSEPTTLAAIQAARPHNGTDQIFSYDRAAIADQIHGGWLGRATGCCLGKPVEGWKKESTFLYQPKKDVKHW